MLFRPAYFFAATICPVFVALTFADADSHLAPSGRPRTADIAIIDDVSKIDRSWRAASSRS